jgi:hypothetical protein
MKSYGSIGLLPFPALTFRVNLRNSLGRSANHNDSIDKMRMSGRMDCAAQVPRWIFVAIGMLLAFAPIEPKNQSHPVPEPPPVPESRIDNFHNGKDTTEIFNSFGAFVSALTTGFADLNCCCPRECVIVRFPSDERIRICPQQHTRRP